MTTIAEFHQRLADRLRVDDSYLTTDIPSSVERYVKRLLRDYHFPKAVRKEVYADVAEGNQSYTLPDDFKKELLVVFMDDTDTANLSFGQPLVRREGFVLPESDLIARRYWQEGTTLWTDITVPADAPNTNLVLVYESNDYDYNIGWMLSDLEDVLFSLSMFRLSGELDKPELLQIWAGMWAEDQRSLAIFANELEFGHFDMVMREPSLRQRGERYPA